MWKLLCPSTSYYDLGFLFSFRNLFSIRLIGQTNEAGEDGENFDLKNWKADSEIRKKGARELGVDDTDMVSKDSKVMCFGSCLSEMHNTKFLKHANMTVN